MPQISHAATLFLSPSSGNYSSGGQVSVSVRVNTEGESINAVDGTIGFNPAIFEVRSITKGSAINLWVQEPSYSNSTGNVNFGGVVLNPGYSGSNGNIITIVFRAKGDGQAEVNFKAGSILANDGYGTNVLKAMNGASFNISASIQQQPQTSPKAEALVVVSGFEISSSTHPDQKKWYSNNDPVFEWPLLSGTRSVKLVLARNPSSPPLINYDPPISKKELSDVEDGIWYFKAQFNTGKASKPAVIYKFQIDTRKPTDFTIGRIDESDLTNPQPELIFESFDDLSGIDHYEMKIGEGDWFNIEPDLAGKPYKLPLQAPGTKEISIKALDRAGNFTTTTTTTTTTVEPIESPIIDQAIPSKIRSGWPLIVSGRARAEQKVLVFISPFEISLETTADQNGRWLVEYKQLLPKSEYQVHARALDKRGAISNPSNYLTLKVISGSILDQASELLIRGLDILVDLLNESWLFIIAFGALVYFLAFLLVKKIVPVIAYEIRKIEFIASEYKTIKRLQKIDSKTKLELKILLKDIKEELDLLHKIESHRQLHPDEQYLKNKLEKYHSLIKDARGDRG